MLRNRRSNMVEEWRDIDGGNGYYQVSNLGRIRRCGKIREVVFAVSVCGRFRRIAHLVLEAFVGPRPKGMFCCHRDDNPRNNVLSNLRWGTPSDNTQDAIRNGVKFLSKSRSRGPGEQNGASIVTNDTAREIRRLRELDPRTWSYSVLARKFSIGRTTVRHIIAGETYTT